MNEFREKLKVNLDEKEQRKYEEYKKKRFSKVIQNPKWKIAKKRLEGEER